MRIIGLFAIFFLTAINAMQAIGWLQLREKKKNGSRIKNIVFSLGDMQCGITETRLIKLEGENFKIRDLYCRVSSDTTVSIDLPYNLRDKNCEDSLILTVSQVIDSY